MVAFPIESEVDRHIGGMTSLDVQRSRASDSTEMGSKDVFHWVKQFTSRRSRKSNESVLHFVFKPMWIGMGIVGVIPLSLKSPHVPCAHPLRSTLLYSLAVYGVVMYTSAWRFVCDHRKLLDPNNNTMSLDERLFTSLFFVHILCLLFVPVFWFVSRHLGERMERVHKYLGEYERVVGEPLQVLSARRAVLVTSVMVVVGIPVLGKLSENIPNQTVFVATYVPAYIYAALVQKLSSTTRVLFCHVIQTMARAQAEYFEKICLGSRSARPEDVRQVRILWIHLREVYYTSGGAHNLELLMGINLFLIVTLVLYVILVSNLASSVSQATLLLMMLSLYAFELFVICTSSQQAMEEMKDPFIRILDQLSLSRDGELREEVKLFFATMSLKPAAVRLADFVDIDRALFAKILSSIITYLVILVQFRGSNDDPPKNATMTF